MNTLKTLIITLMLTIGMAASAQVAPTDSTSGKVIEINEAQFRQLISESGTNWAMKSARPAVVDFNALWCGPCRALTPVLEQLAKEYEGKIDFYSVNVDNNKALSKELGIKSIPLVLFCPVQGQPETMVGVPVETVEEMRDTAKITEGVMPYIKRLLGGQ